MNWEAVSKLTTANLAVGVIGFILWEQTKALHTLAEGIMELVRIYSGS